MQALKVVLFFLTSSLCILWFCVSGEHQLSLFWSGVQLPNSPVVGVCGNVSGGAMITNTSQQLIQQNVNMVQIEKVVLTGQGLEFARCNELTEFVIDGTDAGAGKKKKNL